MQELIRKELQEAQSVLDSFINDEKLLGAVSDAGKLMANSINKGGKIISCGNGGSHCDAMHFAEELTGRYRDNRPAMPAVAISDVSHITCVGNDYGFDQIFSRYIEGLGNPDDVLLGISTSGNSPNILNALEAAKQRQMKVVILTGKDGGKLSGLSDVEICVPHFGYADRIQEIHIKVIHILILMIEQLSAE